MNKTAPPHPETIEALRHINRGNALDLGCGRGRNSVFLSQNGFNVTALDISETSIKHLQDKNHSNIDAKIYNAETAAIQNKYDLILSTVVLQFLAPECIATVISNIQNQTNENGINLIIAPISSQQTPCPIDFPFTLKPNELKEFYKSWEILKFNEDEGEFHRTDKQGNRYKANFATIIARKIK